MKEIKQLRFRGKAGNPINMQILKYKNLIQAHQVSCTIVAKVFKNFKTELSGSTSE